MIVATDEKNPALGGIVISCVDYVGIIPVGNCGNEKPPGGGL